MVRTKAARRYATALLESAKETNAVDDILADINLIKNTLEDSKELIVFLRSPVIKFDDKMQALEKIFSDRVQDMTNRFLQLLARKNRIHLLDQITEAFIQRYNKYAGIIEIDVYSARELDDAQQDDLHKALENKTGKKVDMNLTLDESLKGGLAVRIEDTVIDGTIKHKLQELEQKFLSTAIE